MWLLIRAEKSDADLKAASLRVNGKNIRENEHVKMGSYHTLDIEPGKKVKIGKREWSTLDLELLDQAASAMSKSEVAAVLIQEGTAVFCCFNEAGDVRHLDRVEHSLPKKKLGSTSKMDAAVDKFYTLSIDKLRGTFELDRVKAMVVAGPGDAKDELYKRLLDHAVKQEDKTIHASKSKIIRIALPNIQANCLKDILKEPRIASILSDTKTAQEGKLLDTLFKSISDETGYGVFGLGPVTNAAEQGAVKTLLLSDGLFRSSDISVRKKFASLVDTVKQNGGQVSVLTQGSDTYNRLASLSGVAAILLFPIFNE
jgi:protein pelota